MEYPYPIDESWDKDEVIDAINFFQMVERAYEQGVKREDVLMTYTRFKQIVPSKSEEKQIDKQFEKDSGYSTYRTVQKAKQAEEGEKIKMN
ncbi:UPF0223 family protein [Salinibacillus xinjiangensis]|uniref:UPF0223 protein GH754_04285 n=1 Tax=Salinibacillus xinjiangensis TaxID=1229268 RepID=A0A6G1X3Z1_9BACI|nr:UPF0223 family protein [Salinibacillus xinjiangensis]MRG85548.1 hypothetical protein [Salinibacillus xinjiangensis]